VSQALKQLAINVFRLPGRRFSPDTSLRRGSGIISSSRLHHPTTAPPCTSSSRFSEGGYLASIVILVVRLRTDRAAEFHLRYKLRRVSPPVEEDSRDHRYSRVNREPHQGRGDGKGEEPSLEDEEDSVPKKAQLPCEPRNKRDAEAEEKVAGEIVAHIVQQRDEQSQTERQLPIFESLEDEQDPAECHVGED